MRVRPFLQAANLPTACATRQAAAFLLQPLLVSLRVAWARETCSMTKPLLLSQDKACVELRIEVVDSAPGSLRAARSHSSQASSKIVGDLSLPPRSMRSAPPGAAVPQAPP